MAPTATTRQSKTREQRGAKQQPGKASKPGTPSTAAPRRGGAGANGAADAKPTAAKKGVGAKAMSSAGGAENSELLGLLAKRLAQRELRRLRRLAHDGVENVEKGVARRSPSRAPSLGASRRSSPGRSTLSSIASRLPVQESIDVAVPIEFAWRKWMELRFLPEGAGRVVDIERDGTQLGGRLTGRPGGADWRAEIVDERECESFAWRSTEGSDCAGLVTFHRLSDRLTRIELDLDIVPVGAVDAVSLLSHLAHWQTAAQMRQFKAGLEFVSPDAYDDEL